MFIPRLIAPEYGNKYYNKRPKGYNPCIIGNYPYNSAMPSGYPGLNTLPNCTSYATGRFNEIIGNNKCEYLGEGNANEYYKRAINAGLKVGREPKLGACAVWDDGKYGHVAIVEQIVDKDTIIVSESGWYSTRVFWTAKHTRGKGNWINGQDYSWMKSSRLLGFIYNPAIKDEDDEVITNITIYNEDTERTAIVKGLFKDGRNYLSINDLANLGVLKASYDESKNLPSIGKKDDRELISIMNQDDGKTYVCDGYFTASRNYIALSDLADMGVMSVSYDTDKKMPVIGKK